MAQDFAQPVENLNPVQPAEAGAVVSNQVNVEPGDIETLKVSLNFSLEKLNEFQTTVAQNLENIGTELVNAPVWSDEERQALTDAFTETHDNYYEYVQVIDALEEQSRLLLNSGKQKLKEDGLSSVFDAYASLNSKLTDYKQKMKELADSLAKVQATLPNVSLAESSKGEYESLSRNSLASVNKFILGGIDSLAIKDNAESPEDKKHNLEINFIYNLYSKEDFKSLSASFLDLENKAKAIEKAIADKNGISLEQLSVEMKKNNLKMPREIQDLFLVKNYFDLQPGLAESIEKKVQYLEYTKNELLKKYNTENDLEILKVAISNPDYYNADHLRQFVKDRIINDPTELLESLEDKAKVLYDFRDKDLEKGGKMMEVKKIKDVIPVEESVAKMPAETSSAVESSNAAEEAFFAKGEKMDRVAGKISAQLEKQASDNTLEVEEMPKSEYEASFWKNNQELYLSYNNYLADLLGLADLQNEDIKAKLNKVAETTKEYFKNYIQDNYNVLSDLKLKEDLQKYLVDQNLALAEVKKALHVEDLTGSLEEASKEDIAEAFWNKHKALESKMERYANVMMDIKRRLEAMAPEQKQDDWTANVLTNVENYIAENYATQSEEEIALWVDKYLETELANVRELEIVTAKKKRQKEAYVSSKDNVLVSGEDLKDELKRQVQKPKVKAVVEELSPVTDDQIISEEKIEDVPSTAELSFAKKKPADEIELDSSDIEYVEDKKVAVPPPIPAAALNKDNADAAAALASFEKAVPAEEKVTEAAASLGELGKMSLAEETIPEMEISNEELDKAAAELFDNSDFAAQLAELPDMPAAREISDIKSGEMETDMSTVKDLGIKKAEEKVIAPPDSVPFTEAEEEFFAKGEWNDYKKKVEIALEKNKRIFEWVQNYLEINGYKKLDLNQIVNTLSNDEFFNMVNDALLLFDRFEQYNEESELNDLKVSAEDPSSQGTMRRIKVGDEYFSFKPEDYLKLINLRIKYLEESLKKNIRWRDASKKDNKAA